MPSSVDDVLLVVLVVLTVILVKLKMVEGVVMDVTAVGRETDAVMTELMNELVDTTVPDGLATIAEATVAGMNVGTVIMVIDGSSVVDEVAMIGEAIVDGPALAVVDSLVLMDALILLDEADAMTGTVGVVVKVADNIVVAPMVAGAVAGAVVPDGLGLELF